MRQSEDLCLHHCLSVCCCCLCASLRMQTILNADQHRQPAKDYKLSPYHPPYSLHHSALDGSVNLQPSSSCLSFLPVHRLHPNQVQQSTRCCVHVGCNTACWPSGWHQTWRCEMSPLGAVVWLEQQSDTSRHPKGEEG